MTHFRDWPWSMVYGLAAAASGANGAQLVSVVLEEPYLLLVQSDLLVALRRKSRVVVSTLA